MAFLLADVEPDYDLRLQLRSPQKFSENIIMVHLETDLQKNNRFQSMDEMGAFLESGSSPETIHFSSTDWTSLLQKILEENPAVIGVSPFISENANITINSDTLKIVSNSKIIWATQKDSDGQMLNSKFAKARNKNAGLNELIPDGDGIVRRFVSMSERYPHFVLQILRRYFVENKSEALNNLYQNEVINYRGRANTYNSISASDVLNKKFQRDIFNNKIVLIGAHNITGANYRTPLGELSRLEINANIIDHLLNKRSIIRQNIILSAMLILFFVVLAAVFTSQYPQFLAFAFIVILNIFYSAISIWLFDRFYIWLPILSTATVSAVTYLVFLSFQLTLKEYINSQLEREHRMLSDLEQLKNNFLSLISHDLKTPIAKIQAICDRLLNQYPNAEFSTDLNSLRNVSSELYRYIRTILQITRVESRDFRLSKDATDVNEIIEAVIEQLDPLAKNKKIHFKVKLEPMFLIEIDHILIHEVVLNLIDNAIKYTPEGGEIAVTSQEVDESVIIMVQDSGPGIPETERQRIFEKFYRGELGKSQPKGSGLGLYLVKYFVELHGGRVFLDSSPKHGTKVGFSLPVVEAQDSVGILTDNQAKEENYANPT